MENLFDNAKDIGYNGSGKLLHLMHKMLNADQDSDATGNDIDQLSNGFKVRSSDWRVVMLLVEHYIYMAFAENPIVATSGTSAIPVTAR